MTMRWSRLIVVIMALAAVGGLAAVILRDRTGQTGTGVNRQRSNPNANVAVEGDAVSRVLAVVPERKRDERIVLFGAGLVNQPNDLLGQRLHAEFDLPVSSGGSGTLASTAALDAMAPVFRQPPQYLVLDVGRFEPADSATSETPSVTASGDETTFRNLTVLAMQARQFGIQTVFVTGVNLNGSATFGGRMSDRLRSLVGAMVDATPLLLSSDLRLSPTELNEQGLRQLNDLIVAAFSGLRTP